MKKIFLVMLFAAFTSLLRLLEQRKTLNCATQFA